LPEEGMMLILEEVQSQPAKVLKNYGLHHLIATPEPVVEPAQKK